MEEIIAKLPVKVYGEEFEIGIRMYSIVSNSIRFELVDIYPNLEPITRGCFFTRVLCEAFDHLEDCCGKRLTKEQKSKAIAMYQKWEKK